MSNENETETTTTTESETTRGGSTADHRADDNPWRNAMAFMLVSTLCGLMIYTTVTDGTWTTANRDISLIVSLIVSLLGLDMAVDRRRAIALGLADLLSGLARRRRDRKRRTDPAWERPPTDHDTHDRHPPTTDDRTANEPSDPPVEREE